MPPRVFRPLFNYEEYRNMFGGGNSLEKQLFNLKFAAKNLERSSKKCEKEEKAEKLKLKRAIQKGNIDGAKIHAENAIRQKSQALHFLKLSSRVDAVSQRVQSAVTMKQVTGSMSSVVKSMDSALKSMDLEKVSAMMEKFERQFEQLDVQTQVMDETMSSATTLSVPQNSVDSLMQQVADEHGLEVNLDLPQGEMGAVGAQSTATDASLEQDELSQRLAKLRQ